MGPFFAIGFGTELIYSFVIIVCSMMIYFATKEMYELSEYKGIKYFRSAFLFFAVAYFFRSVLKYLFFLSDMYVPHIFGLIGLLVFIYASTMAIFYLLYSVMTKKWNGKKIYLFHAGAFFVAIISVLSRNMFVYLGVNLVLFILVAFIVYIAYKKSRNSLYAIYLLLFAFWIFNIIDILLPRFLELFQLLIYMISSGIFLLILYKVLRKVGSD
ncbi:hypothetical protein J4468_03260 [Candidatus Woesearchaeota archaeon]|nr:hypothetical protein [Candidatus Woesearchaeota archaeon]